ncbi:MAG: chloride channel protein [Bacteroidales bacterium]|nr:chloride channel protein [Bacteroidales bacterium]
MKGLNRLHINRYYRQMLMWKTKRLKNSQVLAVLSFIVGICCGLAAVILKNIVSYTYNLITSWSFVTADRGNFLFLMYPMIGIAITVLIVRYVIKDDLSHGVSKVMFAISRKGGKIAPHNCWSSMLTSSITVAFGGSVGLEAPIVYTGSAIASNISRFFRLNSHLTTLLIGCGAAGAIAGAFKAPIAGILFAFEVLMLDLSMVSVLPMLISAITAAMIAYFFLGPDAQFSYSVTTPFELAKIPSFIILGVVSAIISLYYFRVNGFVTKMFRKLNAVWKIIVGGILLGTMVYIFPPLFGEGYAGLNELLKNDMSSLLTNSFFFEMKDNLYLVILISLAIVLIKAFATTITCASGGVGGVFAPSLFIGGFVGFFVARLINVLGIGVSVEESNFVLVGMASVMAGIMYAPMTSIFLIAEITGGYALFAPLMISTTICYLVVRSVNRYSIYAQPLAKHGDLMTHNKDKTAIHFMDKSKILETNFYKLNEDDTLRDIVRAVENSSRSFFPVVDKDNNFKGVIVLDDVRGVLFHSEFYDKLKVKSFMRYSEYFIADINDSMEKIVKKFKGVDRYTIIILDKGKFVGCMSRANVFLAYQNFIHNNSDE